MIFNPLAFLIFLPLVFSCYWLIGAKGHWRAQNLLVVAASYVFYGWWNWHFLALISITALWAFASGVLLDATPNPSEPAKAKNFGRRTILVLALAVNLGILGYFK